MTPDWKLPFMCMLFKMKEKKEAVRSRSETRRVDVGTFYDIIHKEETKARIIFVEL